ncbi:MAG: hypothetical protein INH41_29180 [Myxococcaceae bacterium]|nr:hypothetical protein [Myxococcaceae bacterium]
METMLVRLKSFDPRRGCVLRRFTYAGIKFHEERGWYRVDKPVADYVRVVRQTPGDEVSQLAFDVCTEEEAKALDTREESEAKVRKAAADDVRLSPARGDMTTADLAKAPTRSARKA